MVRRAFILLTQSVLLVWTMMGCSAGRSTGDLEGTVVARVVATLESAKTASIATEVPPEPTATPVPEPTAITEPSVTPPPQIETQEYAVYSAMIQQNPIGFDLGPSILIREQTVSGLDSFERTLEEGRPLPARLVDSYRSRNTVSYALDPSLDVELDYALMPEEEFRQIFLRGGSASARFHDRYPKASGVVSFSRVGFDANEGEAVVLMGYVCGDLCAAGGLYLLVKEEGNWKIRESLMEWMA
jgi:hypothetical protein